MKKRKLTYTFHNPNPLDVTVDYVLKILIEANAPKVEQAIRAAADAAAQADADAQDSTAEDNNKKEDSA